MEVMVVHTEVMVKFIFTPVIFKIGMNYPDQLFQNKSQGTVATRFIRVTHVPFCCLSSH